nr:MAG TPA: hypothetical protein [Caudoviricetes sp.]
MFNEEKFIQAISDMGMRKLFIRNKIVVNTDTQQDGLVVKKTHSYVTLMPKAFPNGITMREEGWINDVIRPAMSTAFDKLDFDDAAKIPVLVQNFPSGKESTISILQLVSIAMCMHPLAYQLNDRSWTKNASVLVGQCIDNMLAEGNYVLIGCHATKFGPILGPTDILDLTEEDLKIPEAKG